MRDFGKSWPIAGGEEMLYFLHALRGLRLKQLNQPADAALAIPDSTGGGGQITKILELLDIENGQFLNMCDGWRAIGQLGDGPTGSRRRRLHCNGRREDALKKSCQVPGTDWFRHIVIHAQCEVAFAVAGQGMCGHGDNGRTGFFRQQGSDEFHRSDAVKRRHLDIHENDVVPPRDRHADGNAAIARQFDFTTQIFEHAEYHVLVYLVVLGHEDPERPALETKKGRTGHTIFWKRVHHCRRPRRCRIDR